MDLKLRNDRGFNTRQDDGESGAPASAWYGHDKSCSRPLGRLCPVERARARAPACRGTTPSRPLPAAALAPRILVRRNNAPPAPSSTTFPTTPSPHYRKMALHTFGGQDGSSPARPPSSAG